MKKRHCGECIYLKYEDMMGDGYCELWQSADVNVEDEACVEFEESEQENEFENL